MKKRYKIIFISIFAIILISVLLKIYIFNKQNYYFSFIDNIGLAKQVSLTNLKESTLVGETPANNLTYKGEDKSTNYYLYSLILDHAFDPEAGVKIFKDDEIIPFVKEGVAGDDIPVFWNYRVLADYQPMVIEAENMEQHFQGGRKAPWRGEDVFFFWNGYLSSSFESKSEGKAILEVHCSGRMAENVVPKIEIRLNESIVYNDFIPLIKDFQRLSLKIPIVLRTNENNLRISFVNGYGDRDFILDKVIIKGLSSINIFQKQFESVSSMRQRVKLKYYNFTEQYRLLGSAVDLYKSRDLIKNDGYDFLRIKPNIGGIYRSGILAWGQSEFKWELRLPPRPILRFYYSMLPEVWNKGGDGVLFEVEITDIKSGKKSTIFSKYIDPKHNLNDQKWHYQEVNLDNHSNREITLCFRTLPGYKIEKPFIRESDSRFDFAVWGNPEVYSQKNIPDKPNVVIFLIDALCPDHLGCYGYERDTSPHIDQFASTGIIFKNCFAQSSWTKPSVASMFTSLYPSSHGSYQIDGDLEEGMRIGPNAVTLAEILRSHGYATAAFSDMGHVSKTFGFDAGFDSFYNLYEFAKKINGNTPIKTTINPIYEYLKNNVNRPNFLYIHTVYPHDPYAPPEEYNIFSQPGSSFNGDIRQALLDKIPVNRDEVISLYDGEILYSDTLFRQFLEKLEELNIRDNSVIILLADHGEPLNQNNHGFWRHGNALYDEDIKIPLIISFPKKNRIKGSVNAIVQSIDIMPTILDYLNIAMPQKIQGKSLMPLLLKKSSSLNSEGYVFCELNKYQDERSAIYAYRTDKFKYIFNKSTGKEELYDIIHDPEEAYNLTSLEPQLASELRKKVLDKIENLKNFLPKRKQLLQKIKIPKEVKKSLKALGYIK